MTWREGVAYWRKWADGTDGNLFDDIRRLTSFYEAMVQVNPENFDDTMPDNLAKHLGMEEESDD